MKTYNKLYEEICSMNNLANAWKEAKKHKTKKIYVIEFEKNLRGNLLRLRKELLEQTYKPEPLVTFTVHDPKSRKISKSEFRDRIIHHAIFRVIEPIFDKTFIYDSCANRKGKGNLFALKRFEKFVRKVSENGKVKGVLSKNQIKGYCLKADIKHYFREVDNEVLLKIIKRKITDEKLIWLIKQIINNSTISSGGGGERLLEKRYLRGVESRVILRGMPLGNLTSQFFANIYLNEFDYFVKHQLSAKFYIRYVDDFVILHKSKTQLQIWKKQINNFLINELKLELHKDKSKIISLSRGIDFVGFRNFYYFKLLRKRNIKKMNFKIQQFKEGKISQDKIFGSFQGWNAYSMWADTLNVRIKIFKELSESLYF